MTDNKNTFKYTYSAREQAEIKKIREKYTEPEKKEKSNIEKLRALDASVTKKASLFAIVLGVIGALTLGAGMSLTMTDFANILGTISYLAMPIGIVLGLIGIVLVALAYPMYNMVAKSERARIAPEIIRLTDELLK